MTPTNQDVKLSDGANIITLDGRRLVANCGGYQSSVKSENAHETNIANAES